MISILEGDCRAILPTLPSDSFHCVVTSPPYFGLRDYGVAGQIGLESTLDAYLAEMVAVFREVRRVLRPDGTTWLNIGDSYAGSWGAQGRKHAGKHAPIVSAISANQVEAAGIRLSGTGSLSRTAGLKPKDLMLVPARLALALQADGWWIRSEIIWAKPNPMPESVTDRPTSSHEKIFMLAKSERYFFDAAAVSEVALCGSKGASFCDPRDLERHPDRGHNRPAVGKGGFGGKTRHAAQPAFRAVTETRNVRNVWSIATRPFAEAHFATFPPELAERCIKAGCPIGGVVLDPFGGAGTTGLVADRLQRDGTLIELNPAYAAMARRRIDSDAPLFAEAAE